VLESLDAKTADVACKFVRFLWRELREREAIRKELEFRPIGKAGRRPGLSKKNRREAVDVFWAVRLLGVSKADVIREGRKKGGRGDSKGLRGGTWAPTSSEYERVNAQLCYMEDIIAQIQKEDPPLRLPNVRDLPAPLRRILRHLVLSDLLPRPARTPRA
jgi:hypothetical protein